ncbi:MAG: hypothetical protein AB7Y46_15200 [Armatimonadota bacterium]
MAVIDRNDAIWYYRLGGQTLGPVPWTEIETLIADTLEADHLLVARGGDQAWMTAAEALSRFPELAGAAAAPPSAPSPAGEPAVALPRPTARSATGGWVPEHGLGRWITQAWEMVIEDLWPWVGALLLSGLVGSVSVGILGPPLTAGLYMMALRRFDGRRLRAGDVFEGFTRFWPSWGLTLLMMVPMFVLMLPFFAIVLGVVLAATQMDERVMPFAMVGVWALYPVLWLAMLGVQVIFFYSWTLVADGRGAWEAIVGSWEKVRQQFWSYLGMYLLLTMLAGAGAYACYWGCSSPGRCCPARRWRPTSGTSAVRGVRRPRERDG